MTVDGDNRLIQVSRFGAHQLGHEPSEISDQPVVALYPQDQHDLIEERLAAIGNLEQGAVMSWEAAMITSEGQRRWIRHTDAGWPVTAMPPCWSCARMSPRWSS